MFLIYLYDLHAREQLSAGSCRAVERRARMCACRVHRAWHLAHLVAFGDLAWLACPKPTAFPSLSTLAIAPTLLPLPRLLARLATILYLYVLAALANPTYLYIETDTDGCGIPIL
jgi:hypothetical protein